MDVPQAVGRTEFDLWVSATPAQIILLAESLDARLTDYGTGNAFCDLSDEPDRVRIRFGVGQFREVVEGQPHANDFGWITARAEGNGSRLAVQYWDEDGGENAAVGWWDLFQAEMGRKGWEIVFPGPVFSKESALQRIGAAIDLLEANGEWRGTGERRKQVARLVLEGAHQREIANELFVSEDTVKKDVQLLRQRGLLQ